MMTATISIITTTISIVTATVSMVTVAMGLIALLRLLIALVLNSWGSRLVLMGNQLGINRVDSYQLLIHRVDSHQLVVNQVDITEVTMAVVGSTAVGLSFGVLSSWGTGLDVAVAIGADHKGVLVLVVEAIMATPAWVETVILVASMRAMVTTVSMGTMMVVGRGSSTGHHSQENENLHCLFFKCW
jgi:hypothetical protein